MLFRSTQISEIIHDAVGDEAELIFGAVLEPSMQGEIRVTVIATGFDKQMQVALPPGRQQPGVIQFPQRPSGSQRQSGAQQNPAAAAGGAGPGPAVMGPRRPSTQGMQPSPAPSDSLPDMEIPTFIRRQMD